MIERRYAEVTFIIQANIAASEPVNTEKLVEFRKRALLLANECGLWLASGTIKVGGVEPVSSTPDILHLRPREYGKSKDYSLPPDASQRRM